VEGILPKDLGLRSGPGSLRGFPIIGPFTSLQSLDTVLYVRGDQLQNAVERRQRIKSSDMSRRTTGHQELLLSLDGHRLEKKQRHFKYERRDEIEQRTMSTSFVTSRPSRIKKQKPS
jgi:hypothetical protein